MKKTLISFVAVMCLAAPRVFASNTTFMFIPGIPGESTDARHPNWIDVDGMAQTLLDGDRKSSGPQCSVDVRKHLDVAGPRLWLAAVTGQAFDQIQIELVSAGGLSFYRILLNNARVTSITTTDDNATPSEHLTLDMTSVTIVYGRQKPDGTLDSAVTTTFGC
jgi:type VI secretion system secreted protein Hcp